MKFPTSLGVVALLAASFASSAMALSLSQAATPAETPPASYSKDVYVDSRGCVYVRASIGTAVNWVPRLSHDRETVVCGMTPSASVAAVAATPPAPPAPPPPAAVVAAPTLASAPPAPVSAPVQGTPVSVPGGAGGVSRTMEVTCPANGTVTRVQIGGDTVAVSCPRGMSRTTSYVVTHADGSRSRLVTHPPKGGTSAAYGSGYGLTHSAPPLDPVPTPGYVTRPARQVQPPAGYKPAWDDDRLNPYRGPRTPYGDAQMSSVLDTSKLPMPAADPAPVRTVARTVVISKSQPDAAAPAVADVVPGATGARFVQVGAFGLSGNANRAVARLQGLGFTAATSQTGSGLTLVMAGPFANATELTQALQTLRGYYPDAYPRG